MTLGTSDATDAVPTLGTGE